MCNLAAAMQVSAGGYSGWLCDNNTPKLDICTWVGVTCTSFLITKIDLKLKNIYGSIPTSLGGLLLLTYLDLRFDHCDGTIPTSLGGLSSLRYLDLGYNNLVGPIPNTLGSLSLLSRLILSSNQLVGPIPSTLCSITKLTNIHIYGNPFACYYSCLSSVTSNDLGGIIQCV